MTEVNTSQTRLILLCGLPASGKTTLARELADVYGAVRLNPDEWELTLGVDPFDQGFQVKLEAAFWDLAQRLLVLGTSVVLEWGFWARSERDEKREAARALGVAVELRFLDVSYEELVSRVVARHDVGGIAITESHMEQYRAIFQPPTDEELRLYDPPLHNNASRGPNVDDIPRLTPRMGRSLRRALEIARENGQEVVGTEHVLLAFLDDQAGIAGMTLRTVGNARVLRAEIMRIITSEGYRGTKPVDRPSRARDDR